LPIGIYSIALSVAHLDIDLIIAFQTAAIMTDDGRLIVCLIGVS
jgi:hypothetical protein